MITWIQTYFQKHFRAIFAVLLGVTIISFIFGINASGGFGRGEHQVTERPFFGHDLNSEQEAVRIARDGELSAMLRRLPLRYQQELDEYTRIRIAGAALADELHLPMPTEQSLAAYIATVPAFQKNGAFDPTIYSDFSDSLKNNPRFTIADVNRVFRADARLNAVNQLLGGPGYVLPADIRELLTRTDTKWSIAIATLDYATFDPGMNVTEEALKKFFEEKSGNYEVAPRARLSAVEFHGAEFAATGPVPEDQLRAFYNSNLTRFPAPAEPAKDPKAPVAAPEAGLPAADAFAKVRAQVEITYRIELGSRAAIKAANDFAVALYERRATANSPELAAFLASQKRSAAAVEPFAPDNPPAAMPWLAEYGEQISRLGKERFFSDPLPTPDGAIILLWNETLPAYQPAFAEAREKVLADYRENEKRKRFVAQGQTLRAKLTAALKTGIPFEKAAADSKLEVKSFANFTLQNTPKDMPAAARETLQSLQAGEIADMIATGDKGYLVYAAQKQLPDLTPANPRFAEIRSRLMVYLSATTGNGLLGNLVKAELEKTAPASPTAAR